jgi:hypothetical protein
MAGPLPSLSTPRARHAHRHACFARDALLATVADLAAALCSGHVRTACRRACVWLPLHGAGISLYLTSGCQSRACPSDRPAHSARFSTSSAPLLATDWRIPCTLHCLHSDSTCMHAPALACGRRTSASRTAVRTVQVAEMRGHALARRRVRTPTLCPLQLPAVYGCTSDA